MRCDVHFYGTVAMPDAGAGPPAPTDRRAANEAVADCYANLCRWAVTADALGYNTLWLTEHHFQHEGYEVTPNLILFGVHLAGLTARLRFGQMFNIVPQWHPLRLAEDFAMADLLTGGRMVFGVGRGTVPREARTLGAVVASADTGAAADADRLNRELFEEGMAVIRAAWAGERFSFAGAHFVYPPPGIGDRGGTVRELTLVPRPVHTPVEVFQPISSPATLAYAAAMGHVGVFALGTPEQTRVRWDEFAAVAETAGRRLGPGEGRCLQLIVHVAPTTAAAGRRARPGHDEYVKFLAPYGRFDRAFPDRAAGFRPSLEETRRAGVMAIGSVEEVVDQIGRWSEILDLRHLVMFPELPGLTPDEIDEQLHLFAGEVAPRIGAAVGVAS